MTTPLEELKIRARLRVKALRGAGQRAQLGDELHQAARACGFSHWEHARRVLGGLARPGDDFGTFWHAPGCMGLFNQWFADAASACRIHAQAGGYLLPYRRQFVLVQAPFLRELGLPVNDASWHGTAGDLVSAYGSQAWQALAMLRLQGAASTFQVQGRSARPVR